MSLRINKICRTVLLLVFIACVFGFFATTFNRSVQAENVAAENFYTEDGASVRYNADTPGIRFTTYITENYYNELKQKAADGVLNFYTLIEKADGSSSSKVKIEHKQPVEFNESGTAVFNAALVFKKASGDLTATEIKMASAIELKASAYVRYTDNMGQTVTESAANGGVVRSMRGIANYAIRVGVSEEQSNFLSMYLGNITIENVLQKVILTDKAAVELFGLTEGAVYFGAKKVGDIAGGKIDLSLVTLPTDSTTEVYVFDKDNNCTIYTCLFVQPLTLTENHVVGLNRPSATYAYTLQGEEPIISVKVGGTEITSSNYLQNGNSVTLNASAFTAAGDTSVVIETSAAVYSGRAEVYDIAIGSLEEFKAFWSREGIPADSTVTSKIVLTADIDASSYSFHGGNVLMGFTFDGILDGKGHTIKGAPSSYFGLMRTLGTNGVIKNVAFTGIKFYRTSAIINDQLNGRIENCYFEGSGGNGAEDNALCKYIQNSTAVLKNVVVYLHDRPSGTETQCGMFRSSLSLTTAPKGVYFVNTSSNGKICDGAGATDLSDVHLYSSLGEFINDVTELPNGFSPDIWRIDENGGLVFTSSPEGLPTFGLHNVKIKENSSRTFVRNKKSEYVIIADNDGAEMAKAVKFITDNVYKATGVTLSKETYVVGRENGWTKNDKLIVFDNERFFAKAGLNMPVENLKNGGYYIKTAGNTVFIMCEGEDGYQLGAIRFLSETLGYDRLSVDCIVYDKNGATIPDMEITEEPDFEYRMPSTFKMPDAVYGMGFNKVNFNAMFMPVPNRATGTDAVTMHNSYNYLPPSMYKSSHPKWYSNAGNPVKQQLCYTAHGDSEEYRAMVDTLYEYLKQIVDANPFMSNITVTQQDNLYYCDCAECTSVIAEYGAVSAAYIMFLNDIDDKLQADLEAEAVANGTKKREVNIVFFAYHGTKKSPTKLVDGKYLPTSEKVIMNEHVGVLVAPIESYYTSSFYSDKNKALGETESIKSWSCLTNKVYMWIYETYFNNYFYPYNSWETILPNYMFCYENNAVYMFDQGQHNQASPSAFMAFKYYLDSKAGINVNRSYKELEEKFFSGYFKEAADSMKNYYNALKVRLKYLEENYPSVDGGINNGKKNVLANASYWSVDILNEYLGYIQTALSDVAFYESTDYATYCMLKNHILAESLFRDMRF